MTSTKLIPKTTIINSSAGSNVKTRPGSNLRQRKSSLQPILKT